MSAGIILARLGFEVTVLEKNRQPGGMMRSYVRQGVHCNVGVHYLGALDEGQVLRRCFDYLGITAELPLVRMGVDGPIDRYLFSDPSLGIAAFDVPAGFEAYEAALGAAFPDQGRQIDALMALLRRSAGQFEHLDFLYSSEPAKHWIEQTEPLGAIFEKLGCRPGLRAVFGLPSVLIGVPPAACPHFFHTMALASYLFSAWRLGSNGAHLADVCARRLAALGGTVRTGDAVAGIRTADGCVQGVTLASGERIDAALVVGTLHPKAMVGLLAPESIKPSYRQRILGLTDTRAMTAVHALVPAERQPATGAQSLRDPDRRRRRCPRRDLPAAAPQRTAGPESAVLDHLRPRSLVAALAAHRQRPPGRRVSPGQDGLCRATDRPGGEDHRPPGRGAPAGRLHAPDHPGLGRKPRRVGLWRDALHRADCSRRPC